MSKTNNLIKQAADVMRSFGLDSPKPPAGPTPSLAETRLALSEAFKAQAIGQDHWADTVRIEPAYDKKYYSSQVESYFFEHCDDLGLTHYPMSRVYSYDKAEAIGVEFLDSQADKAATYGERFGYNHPEVLKYLEFEPICLGEFREWLKSGHGLKYIALSFGRTNVDNLDRDWAFGLEETLINELIQDGCDDFHLAIFMGIDGMKGSPTGEIVWDTDNKPWVRYT